MYEWMYVCKSVCMYVRRYAYNVAIISYYSAEKIQIFSKCQIFWCFLMYSNLPTTTQPATVTGPAMNPAPAPARQLFINSPCQHVLPHTCFCCVIDKVFCVSVREGSQLIKNHWLEWFEKQRTRLSHIRMSMNCCSRCFVFFPFASESLIVGRKRKQAAHKSFLSQTLATLRRASTKTFRSFRLTLFTRSDIGKDKSKPSRYQLNNGSYSLPLVNQYPSWWLTPPPPCLDWT